MTELYDRPDIYDLGAGPAPAMQGFYVETARTKGGRVLDLACGTGRFSIPLAAAGLEVVGGDLSEAMLKRAREAAAERGVDVVFRSLDMRDFDLDGQVFDTVMIGTNSILHLYSARDFEGFFASVARHLAPGGQLLFDAFVPSLALLTSDPDTREAVGTYTHPTLGKVSLEQTTRYDPVAQVSNIQWYWSTETAPDFWQHPLPMRQIFPQELPMLLAANGFRLIERFGDFDRSPLTARSRRQVCICAVS